MSVDVLVWYQRSFTVASCNALHLYQSIRLSFGRYNVHFFQPLFEKVSNYACHIPWPCFQLFTFHSRSRGAPPLLWRRGGLALCWSMLLATKMGSSRPPQMFWFQSCFDFQVLTYWLLRSVSVCVCVYVTPAVQGAFEPTKFWGPTVVVYTQTWYILCTLWYT